MKRLAAWTSIAVVAFVAHGAAAAELCIPFGYFGGSGGFYKQGCGENACLRFAAARGCTIETNFPAAASHAFSPFSSESATYSWYAGQVPPHAGGSGMACPNCQPRPAAALSLDHPEDVGPPPEPWNPEF